MKTRPVIELLEESRDRDKNRAAFIARRRQARSGVWACTRHDFPPPSAWTASGDTPETAVPWFSDHEEFCERFVDRWQLAIDALREAGLGADEVRWLYDPAVRAARRDPAWVAVIQEVRTLFLRALGASQDEEGRQKLTSDLASLRRTLADRHLWLQTYFEGLADQVGKATGPDDLTSPTTLYLARGWGVSHSDLAHLLGVSGADWYLNVRKNPSRFRARVSSEGRRGQCSIYLMGDLLTAFERLASRPFGDRELTDIFRSKLRSPDAGKTA